MSEEEKEAIEKLIDLVRKYENSNNEIDKILFNENNILLNIITKLQKENKEKDKQIDLMAELFYKRFKAELLLEYGFENKEELKESFRKEVE